MFLQQKYWKHLRTVDKSTFGKSSSLTLTRIDVKQGVNIRGNNLCIYVRTEYSKTLSNLSKNRVFFITVNQKQVYIHSEKSQTLDLGKGRSQIALLFPIGLLKLDIFLYLVNEVMSV